MSRKVLRVGVGLSAIFALSGIVGLVQVSHAANASLWSALWVSAWAKCTTGAPPGTVFAGDGQVNNFDVDPFIELLGGQGAIARRLVWDGENRLARVEPTQSSLPTDGSAKRVSFKYDYLGRRIEKVVETWTAGSPNSWVVTKHRRFVWSGWLMLLELDALNSNAVVRKYTWGLDLGGLAGGAAGGRAALDGAGGIGGLLAVDIQAADPDTSESGAFWFTYDANGNVMELVAGATGYGGATADEWHADRLVGRYEYDPYGNLVNTPSAFALTNPFRFSTKYWDDESGLGDWGLRYVEPRLGRWTSRDPIRELGGMNLYAYAQNNPVSRFDPLGEQDVTQCTNACGRYAQGSSDFCLCVYQCRAAHHLGAISKCYSITQMGAEVALCVIGCAVGCKNAGPAAAVCFGGCTAGCGIISLGISFYEASKCAELAKSSLESAKRAFCICMRNGSPDDPVLTGSGVDCSLYPFIKFRCP